ncbi:MAG: Na+ dependent nucleoside transporter N-terminal domain-containing protein, partial [Pseudomonadota bacterium]
MDILRVIFALAVLLGLCALLSWDRKNIKWRYVLVGLGLQFLIAVMVLGWDFGRKGLDALSRGVTSIVEVSIVGASFVFGESWQEHFIAFAIPSAIIFISTLMALLYYFGIIQFVVRCMAAVMRWVMPVSGAESLAVCANVFIGNTESPLLIKPYIPKFTQSEIMAMMTGGMAT